MTHTHIFHIVLDPILLEVGGCLCPVKPLSRIHICLLKVVPVDLQLVIRVGAQVHCQKRKKEKKTQHHHKDILVQTKIIYTECDHRIHSWSCKPRSVQILER